MNRAERRRQERDRSRGRTVIIGDNIVAAPIGESFNASTAEFAELPAKVPGRHRWIAVAAFVVDMSDRLVGDADTRKILGPRTMHALSVGCYDCEQAYADATGQPCPAEAEP